MPVAHTPPSAVRVARPPLFEVDVLRCSRCGGRHRLVAIYPGGPRLRELLDRLALSAAPAATGVP